VAGALKGMGAVAAGLIVGTALKLTPALRMNPMGGWACALLFALAFVAVALLRWPLVWVLLAVLAFHSLIAKPFYIPSESMMPGSSPETGWWSPNIPMAGRGCPRASMSLGR
jgi:hypothetical protein